MLWVDNNHDTGGGVDDEKVLLLLPNGEEPRRRSHSNYNTKKKLTEQESRTAVDLGEKGEEREDYEVEREEKEHLMNDGFYTEAVTTAPTFNMGQQQRSLEPSFDPTTKKNVTAPVGKSAYLNCRVRHLGNKTVSTMNSDWDANKKLLIVRATQLEVRVIINIQIILIIFYIILVIYISDFILIFFNCNYNINFIIKIIMEILI